MAAAQIGQLQSWTVEKGKASGKIWPVITSANPKTWNAKELLQCRGIIGASKESSINGWTRPSMKIEAELAPPEA